MIDLHCHLLPGIDDGAPDLRAALAMARAAVADGIRVAACTPHIYPGLYENDRAGIRRALAEFAAQLQRRKIPLQLVIGADVHLTPTEFKLLARLVRSAGQVVTHRQLLGDVWGPEFTEHTHYLRLYMAQLRAKLEADPADPQRLLTEPGVGYRLAEPPA